MSRLRRFGVCVAQTGGLLAVALVAVGIGLSTPQGHTVVGEGVRWDDEVLAGNVCDGDALGVEGDGRLGLEPHC